MLGAPGVIVGIPGTLLEAGSIGLTAPPLPTTLVRMAIPIRVLILEDSPTDAAVMVHHLQEAGYAPEWRRVETEAEFLAHLERGLDLILADYTLLDFTARRALELLLERGWEIPTIVVTGTVSEEIALECLRLGAADYLLKDRLARLGPAVRSVLAQHKVQEDRDAALAASRAKSEFLANVSHELRTPLNSILGFAQLLLEQTTGTLSPKHVRYLTNIYTSGQHLLRLVDSILDLSKLGAGRFALQLDALPVAETLEDILAIARGLASRKGQTIEAAIAPGLPPLRADTIRLKQVLLNLLSNAVKFTPEGGRITIVVRQVAGNSPASRSTPTPSDAGGEWLELSVSDTGIGIRAEDLSRLFQDFVQLDAGAAKTYEGTGLGLALTRRLVELHGGRIWAESPGEGRGSTFTVRLPFTGPADLTDATAPESP